MPCSNYPGNDVNMEVFRTMTEEDLREVGITSFGVRRQLKLAIGKLNMPEPVEQKHADDEPVHVPKINLEEELSAISDGRDVVKHLRAGGRPSTSQRQLLVRVAVATMVEKGGNGLWPTSMQKTEMAKLITKTYPSTQDTTEGLQGHEHYYHNGAGFIEYRLKTIRTKLKPEEMQKRRRSSSTAIQPVQPGADHSEEQLTSAEALMSPKDEEMVNWMRYTPPNKENKLKHVQYLKETHEYRRQFIEGGHDQRTATDILNMFPRFQDYPELVNIEFGIMYKDAQDNFITKWRAYRDAIIAIANKEYLAVRELIASFEDGNKDLCGLSSLVYMLHRSVNKTKSKYGSCTSSRRSGALLHLIQHKPLGTDVAGAVEGKEEEYRQPFLLALGQSSINPTQFFIVLDRMVIPAGLDLVPAFDRLFKIHYVFNISYSPNLQKFWEFVDSVIYKVMAPTKAKSQVRELGSAVRAMIDSK
ncbi:uncharacterized protein LOC119733670 [Patiria miniata]|uniref:SAM domain-containing protein n=1 Tax=Patiria miniata TaxID=46514 RepID=A0A914AGZ7_PATMI|nr:uncharacterized protein LOC119733670 [Patiria miniata]